MNVPENPEKLKKVKLKEKILNFKRNERLRMNRFIPLSPPTIKLKYTTDIQKFILYQTIYSLWNFVNASRFNSELIL